MSTVYHFTIYKDFDAYWAKCDELSQIDIYGDNKNNLYFEIHDAVQKLHPKEDCILNEVSPREVRVDVR